MLGFFFFFFFLNVAMEAAFLCTVRETGREKFCEFRREYFDNCRTLSGISCGR